MYKVLRDFTDLKDNRHIYRTGDTFPRTGVTVSDERVAELASANNACGVALIKKIEEKKAQKPIEESKEPVQKLEISPVSDEKEKSDIDTKPKKKAPKKKNKEK